MLPASASADVACANDELVVDDTNQGTVEDALFCLVNEYRRANNVPLLEWDTHLATAARGHSVDMHVDNFFAHVNPNTGLGPDERAMNAGYLGGAGENIAFNAGPPPFGTAWSLFDAWRESCGHNTNMLRSWYVAAGFGVEASLVPGVGAGIYGTQMFGIVDADTPDTGATALSALPPPKDPDPCVDPAPAASPAFGPAASSKPKKCKQKNKVKRKKCRKRRRKK